MHLKRLSSAGILLLALAALPSTLSASLVSFDFTATFETGIGAGTSFTGNGSYDDAGASGLGMSEVPLTSLDFTVFGITPPFSDFNSAEAVLNNGTLVTFDAVLARTDKFSFDFNAGVFYDSLAFGNVNQPADGTGTYTVSTVPEPSPFELCSLGLLLSLYLLRR